MRVWPHQRWLWLLLAVLTLLASLPAANAAGIDFTEATQQDISARASWCITAPERDITDVLTASGSGCTFRPLDPEEVGQGFSRQAFWLRLEVNNPTDMEQERWLRVGHPRLEWVSLFQPDAGGHWQRQDTGLAIPHARHPVMAMDTILPLTLAAGEHRTVYVRVFSQSAIDLSLTLWTPEAYVSAQQRLAISLSLGYGALLAAVVLTLLGYLKWRDRAYLFFAASLLAETLLNASFIGLLPLYFWPAEWAFDTRLTVLAAGSTTTFFALFSRHFIGNITRYRSYHRLLLTCTTLLLLCVLWACVVDLRSGIQGVYPCILATQLSGIALFFRAWRDGSRGAGFLLVSYVLMVAPMVYRLLMAFGGSPASELNAVVYSWRFALITPVILAGIIQRSEKLREAAQQAAARVQFLAQMSHEFRTPLNVMLGYAELLERNSQRVTVPESAAAIKRSGRYLLGMIDEILDHARGVAGKLSLAPVPVDWPAFMAALEQSTSLLVQTQGNRFHLRQSGAMPATLRLDERRFRQVLDVLLSNANRYTRQGDITLHCAATPIPPATPAGPGKIRLSCSVSDTGCGIAPEELEHIFEPFTRGSAGRNSGIDGVGMGLCVAQQLVRLMGGEIGVDSQPGAGSRFFFSLDCELAEAATTVPARPYPGRLSPACTVLVVEDDPANSRLLSLLLADCGFTVHTASSGAEARPLLAPPVELVITDQFMADGDGWQVLRDAAAQALPVILLSAAPPQRPRGFPAGLDFAAVLLKPVNADELLRHISTLLSLPGDEDEAAAEEAQAPGNAASLAIPAPPATLLAPLTAMIEAGAVTDIADWLEDFSHRQPQYAAYAAQLAACNLALDFAGLRRLSRGNQVDSAASEGKRG